MPSNQDAEAVESTGVAGHPDPSRIDLRPVAEAVAMQNSR